MLSFQSRISELAQPAVAEPNGEAAATPIAASLSPTYPAGLLKSPLLQRSSLWLTHALAIVLIGYALLGRGWAYVGIAPLFVGELLLVGSLAWLCVMAPWRLLL